MSVHDIDQIDWIIERKLEDGSWEACCSDACHGASEFLTIDPLVLLKTTLWGSRLLFSIFSGGFTDGLEELEPLAAAGLPADASPYALLNLRRSDLDQVNPGHLTLGQIRARVCPARLSPAAPRERTFALFHSHLEAVLAKPAIVQQVLRGRFGATIGDEWATHPDMRAESVHDHLDRRARAELFLPVDDDSARMVFAYRVRGQPIPTSCAYLKDRKTR
jgi:hypothetical protein